ncbi:MAG: DUF1989 domain-containing protein, partial [Pseudomonadales bacterium]|nr:DUF1989 domain-containing protein [Pseudomonadales bacterium]
DDEVKGCRDCLQDTFAADGIDPLMLQAASCFNIFMNVEYLPDGSWLSKPPVTNAGDYIELRAAMDCYWALSACVLPSAVEGSPTPLCVETYSRRAI